MKLVSASFYPNLKELVWQLPVKIPKNHQVFEAFKEFGEFTAAQAKNVLSGGTSPEIRVGPLSPSRPGGGIPWGNTPDTADHCTLNEIIIQQYEDVCFAATSGNGGYLTDGDERDHRQLEWNSLLARGNLTIEALILHEIVHWGDGQHYRGASPDKYLHQDDAARQAGFEDRGHQFAHAAYGKKLEFIKNSDGYLVTDHEIIGWIGVWRVGRTQYGRYAPLQQPGPAPIRPPSLPR